MDARRRRHAAARSRVAAGALSVAVFLGLGTNMAASAAGGSTATDSAGDSSSTTTEQQGSWSATPAAPSQDQHAVTGSQGS